MSFNNVILNIPHSSAFGFNAEEWSNSEEITRYMREWTDWYTEKLFKPRQKSECIHSSLFPFSRFFVDVERLVNDPMEAIGQGIIYSRFGEARRQLPDEEVSRRMEIYHRYLDSFKPLIVDNAIIVDCHSFPERLAPDVDFCIGFNDDESKPDDKMINDVTHLIRKYGYRVAVNYPFSNSITPVRPMTYKSIMIEVNKRTYMEETTLQPTLNAHHVSRVINTILNGLVEGYFQ